MDIFHGALWYNTLQLLRDPIFALVVSVLLTILASRAVRRVIKTIFYLAAIAVFVWLVTHNKAFADLCITIVNAIFHILLTVIIVLAILCVVALLCVLVMFVVSKPSPRSLRKRSSRWNLLTASREPEEIAFPHYDAAVLAALASGHIDDERAKALLREKQRRMIALTDEGKHIFDDLTEDFDEQNAFMMIVNVLHLYFSGLTPYMTQIKKIHKTCNAEIVDLASILPVIFNDPEVQTLEDMARAKTFLPDKNEWHDIMEGADVEGRYALPTFVLLRLLCLRRDWREVATITYKGFYYVMLVQQRLAILEDS